VADSPLPLDAEEGLPQAHPQFGEAGLGGQFAEQFFADPAFKGDPLAQLVVEPAGNPVRLGGDGGLGGAGQEPLERGRPSPRAADDEQVRVHPPTSRLIPKGGKKASVIRCTSRAIASGGWASSIRFSIPDRAPPTRKTNGSTTSPPLRGQEPLPRADP